MPLFTRFTIPTTPPVTVPVFRGFDVGRLDVSKLRLPTFRLPKLVPDAGPNVDLPNFDLERVAELARDTAYAGLGMVVLAAEKVDARRRQVREDLASRVHQFADSIA